MKAIHCSLSVLLCLSFLACSKSTKVIKSEGSTTLQLSVSGIQKVEDIIWNVGRPQRDAVVSKGVRLEIAFPDLDSTDLRELHKHYGVDAWAARIGRIQGGAKETLGYFYVPLLYQRSDELNERNVQSGMIQILYSDAAPSKRFADFPCPAFGHNLRVTSTTVDSGESASMTVTKGRSYTFSTKAQKLEFGAIVFPGGKKLEGLYWIELAFYNSTKDLILGDFSLLAGTLRINKEQAVAISGCSDFVIPARDENKNRDFKFGR